MPIDKEDICMVCPALIVCEEKIQAGGQECTIVQNLIEGQVAKGRLDVFEHLQKTDETTINDNTQEKEV